MPALLLPPKVTNALSRAEKSSCFSGGGVHVVTAHVSSRRCTQGIRTLFATPVEATSAGVGSSMSMATWRGSVIAHLNRLKRAAGGSRGVAMVAFSIDHKGRVLSARLVRSSGNPGLDKEAVALLRRASPVPPPPGNIEGNSVLLSAPVRVSR